MIRKSPVRAMTVISSLALLAAFPARAHDSAKEGFGELTVAQVEQLIEKKQASIFDNNSDTRFAKSHLPTAKWLKFNEVKEGDLPADKERTLVFYCANTH